jgi:hypothetical protein
MTDPRTEPLIAECKRQAESCTYTSAALYIWQKHATTWRAMFLIAPVILGGLASSQILLEFGSDAGKLAGAFCGMLAGFFPAIYVSLNMDMKVVEIARSAGEFTNLRDRFRQAAEIRSQAPYEEFQAEFEALMDRMDAVRMSSPPSPEWAFKKAQAKVQGGDYVFDFEEPPKRKGVARASQ